MAYVLLLPILWGIKGYAQTPEPVAKIDFEQQHDIRTAAGIVGKAFDLGDVDRRKPLLVPNPVHQTDRYTVTLWVKADKQAFSSYDILSSTTNVQHDDQGWKPAILKGEPQPIRSYHGWKIGMQANGAWQFTIRSENSMYEYTPMPQRQNIRDGGWHMLAFSYDREAEELRFYYDGQQMAIYNIDRLGALATADSLTIGNSAENGYDLNKSVEWDAFYGQIDDISFYKEVLDARQIKKQYEEVVGTGLPEEMIAATRPKQSRQYNVDGKIHISADESIALKTLKVTAFNILHGGNFPGKEIGRNRTIELLKQDNADVITMVETYGSGAEIADALGYHFYLISSNLSIMSRYPIVRTYRVFKSFNSGGVQLALPGGQKANVFSIWLYHLPSRRPLAEPGADVAAFIDAERETRGKHMDIILQEIHEQLDSADEIPLILGGDFNSGSHLDWNEAAASIHHGNVVPFMASTAAEKAGLIDSYREVYSDPVRYPGITWSPMRDLPPERLDFIYYKGEKLTPITSTIIDYHPNGFPSDHAAVSTLFKWDSEH